MSHRVIAYAIVSTALIAISYSCAAYAGDPDIGVPANHQSEAFPDPETHIPKPVDSTSTFCSTVLNDWPLQPFLGNRKTILQHYLENNKSMSINKAGTTADEKTCKTLFARLQSLQSVEVLGPAVSFEVTPAGLPPFPDNNDWNEKPFTGTCTNLDISREYFNYPHYPSSHYENGYAQDPMNHLTLVNSASFNAKTRAEKEATTDGYAQATRNIEIYDLSKYLGEGAKGYFGEAGVEHWLKGQNPFSICHSPQFYPLPIAKVFNSKTCASTSLKPGAPRMGFHQFQNASWTGAYVDSGGFYAFVDISGELYEVDWSATAAMHMMLMQIIPIRSIKTATNDVCAFEN